MDSTFGFQQWQILKSIFNSKNISLLIMWRKKVVKRHSSLTVPKKKDNGNKKGFGPRSHSSFSAADRLVANSTQLVAQVGYPRRCHQVSG